MIAIEKPTRLRIRPRPPVTTATGGRFLCRQCCRKPAVNMKQTAAGCSGRSTKKDGDNLQDVTAFTPWSVFQDCTTPPVSDCYRVSPTRAGCQSPSLLGRPGRRCLRANSSTSRRMNTQSRPTFSHLIAPFCASWRTRPTVTPSTAATSSAVIRSKSPCTLRVYPLISLHNTIARDIV